MRASVAELLDPCRSDAGDVVEVVDRLERPVRRSPIDDLLRGHGPDARELVELVDGRDREAHLRTGNAARPGGGRSRRSAPRDDHLLPVGERRSEVDSGEVGTSRRPACPRDRIRDARPVLQVKEARPVDSAHDMDDECRRGLRPGSGLSGVEAGERRSRRGTFARANAGEARARNGEQRHERNGEHRELRPGERDHPRSVARELSRVCAAFVPKV